MNIRSIIKVIFSIKVAVLISITGFSQDESNSLLYKIEGNGIQTSYLYGTIHVLPSNDFMMQERVKKAFNQSELIALELDMDDPSLPVKMMNGLTMKDGVTLDKLFSPEDYKKLDSELTEIIGTGIAPFNSMKPFIVMSMMISKYVGDQPASFEEAFVKMASVQKKEILGLETIEDQMAVFDDISYETQALELSEMLNNDEKTKELFIEMVNAHKMEDIEALYKCVVDNYDGSSEELDIMLSDRNKKWIPRMEGMAKDKSVFFGVGAAHLAGEEGVINLLKAAGYTVTAI